MLNCSRSSITVPFSLFNFTSLKNLEVVSPCSTFKVAEHNSFPHITSLCLDGVEIPSELSIADTLGLSFLVLETLEVRECKWLNVKLVKIHVPALTVLRSKTPVIDYVCS